MSDNIPFYAQEIPCNMDSEHDLGQRTDPDLPDFNIPDDFDWSDSMDAFDWSANDVPDALGSCNAGPISVTVDAQFWSGQSSQASESTLCAGRSHDAHEQPMQLYGCSAGISPNNYGSTTTASLETSVQISGDDALDHFSSSSPPWHVRDTAVTSVALADEHVKECTVDGCKHNGSFKSAYELNRHIQTVHGGESAKRFVCSARGCFNGTHPWSFARPDKLTSHVKTMHNHSTVFNNCPIATCTFGPCTLEVLGVHIHHAHEFLEEGRAVLNATTCKTRKCPLWRCGKHLVANQLMAHIQTHDSNDLEAAKSTLEMEGFLIEGTTQNGIAVRVICPVCRTITADAVQFMRHLSTDHLQTSTSTSGGYVHFEQWKAYWRQNIPKDSAAELKNLLPWSRIDYFLAFTRILKYRCPCCSFSVADVGGRFWAQANQYQKEKHALIQEHHLSFLRPEAEVVAELYPYRMAILRLCPEFVTHPVFADFNQLSQQSTAMITET